MKTLNNNWKKWWLQAMAIVVSVGVIAGCNSKGGNNNGAPATSTPYGYTPGAAWPMDVSMCAGCFPNAQPLLIGVKATTNNNTFFMSLDILGDPMRANMLDANVVQYYNGPVMLVGTLRITAQDWMTCGATPGDYSIRPIQPGMMTATTINGVVLDAYSQNGVRLTMRLNLLTPYNDTGAGLNRSTDTNRMGMQVMIDMINGAACGSSFTTY